MKRSRGCGCIVLMLGLVNLLVAISVIYGFFAGSDVSVFYSVLMLVVFSGNLAVCVLLARQAMGRETTGQGEPTQDSDGEQGLDEAEGESEGED